LHTVEKNQMTFWDHVDELRARVVKCLWIFFAGFLLFYFVSDHLLEWLRRPLFAHLPSDRQHLYYTGLFENFFVHLRVAAYASFLFLSPVYFLILWGFIAPGLHESERKRVLPFATASSFFFIAGSAFAYFVLFPAGVKYFLAYGTEAEVAWLTLENYVSLVIRILLGFGLAFQLPVVIVLLAKVGVITADSLASQRRAAIVAIAVVSAVVAPPDALSMLLLMGPLYLLYEGAVVVVRHVHKSAPNPANPN
jgi:sec-independent protein translocase protein TatC